MLKSGKNKWAMEALQASVAVGQQAAMTTGFTLPLRADDGGGVAVKRDARGRIGAGRCDPLRGKLQKAGRN